MDKTQLKELRDLAYETGWIAGQAEAGKEVDTAHQNIRIRERNKILDNIAQGHEQEVATLRGQIVLLERQVSLDLAKVAGMAGALRLVQKLTDDKGIAYKSDWLRIEFAMEQALQSAPEVLYHKQAQVMGISGICTPDIHQDDTGLPMVAYMPEGTNTFVGAVVDVIILARPEHLPKGEQGQNSE